MRCFLFVLVLMAAAVPAQAAENQPPLNTLTPEESAAGWSLLFDGNKFTGLTIQGDYQIVDGVLIVGGTKPTQITTTKVLHKNYELRLQYRVEMPPHSSTIQVGLNRNYGYGGGGSSSSLASSGGPEAQNAWNELIFQSRYDSQTGTQTTTSRTKTPHGESSHGGSSSSSEPSQDTVWFSVPPGSKLYLRNIKCKSDPVSWWDTPWPYVAILVVGLLLFCTFLFVVWRLLRRRWAVAYGDMG